MRLLGKIYGWRKGLIIELWGTSAPMAKEMRKRNHIGRKKKQEESYLTKVKGQEIFKKK